MTIEEKYVEVIGEWESKNKDWVLTWAFDERVKLWASLAYQESADRETLVRIWVMD